MMAGYRRWAGRSGSATSKEIHVTGFPVQNQFRLNVYLKDYFSRFGKVQKVRKPEEYDQTVAIITFEKANSVVRTLHYGNIQRVELHSHMCNLHIKPMMERSLFHKIRSKLAANNELEMPLQLIKKQSNQDNKSSDNKTPVNLNPNHSTRLYCTNYSMGKPSEIMDKLLKKYFGYFGHVLLIDRPPEHNGRVAIISFENAASVKKAMRRRNHRLSLNRFGAFNMLTVKVWEDKPKSENAEIPSCSSNNQVTTEASEQSNANQKSSESKDGIKTIFCVGFPSHLKSLKLTNILSRYFAGYGEVVSVNFPPEFSRELAVITFRNSTSVDLVMKFINRHCVPTTHSGNCCSLYVDMYGKENPLSHTSLFHHVSCASCKSVSEQISSLTQTMSLSDENRETRQSCLKRLEEVLKRHFPQANCFLFGPSTNKFGYKECFCDIFFKPGNTYLENASAIKENHVFANGENSTLTGVESNAAVTTSRNAMSEMDTTTANEQNNVADNAEHSGNSDLDLTMKLKHVLISNGITVQDAETHEKYIAYLDNTSEVVCRVWYKNMSSVYESNLLKFYGQFDERVTSLMMVVRMWARHRKMFAETCEQEISLFSERALNWMVIFFLQNCNPLVVPSVDKVMSHTGIKNEIDLETSFCSDVQPYEPSANDSSVEILVWEFFNFFSNYDYSLVMCPRNGDAKYRENVIGDETSTSQFQNLPICIQDPLEVSKNLTSNIGYELFWNFISNCRFAVNFNPNELKNTPKFKFWGILNLFTGLPGYENVRLQSWEFLQPKNEKPYAKFSVQYVDNFVQRVIAEIPQPRKMDPKLIYELVTAVLLHIFNHALLFDAFLQPAPEFKRLETPAQKSQEEVKDETPANNAENIVTVRKPLLCTATDDKPPVVLAKKVKISYSDNAKALSEVNNHECKVSIQAHIEYDTWNERWKYSSSDQLQPEEVNSKTYLGQDENISCLLKEEKTPFDHSLMCRYSFNGSEGFSMELKCDDGLLDSNLLPFLTYFIPMKMDELFRCNIANLVSHLLSKDIFAS